jgi:hypothetical protein
MEKAVQNAIYALPGMPELTTNGYITALKKAGVFPDGEITASDVAVFAQTCDRYQLDPLRKELYLVNFKGKLSIFVGVDGLRKIARTDPTYCGPEITYNGGKSLYEAACEMMPKEKWGDKKAILEAFKNQSIAPVTCECTIKRWHPQTGEQYVDTVASVLFHEYSGGFMYNNMPYNQIGVVAEKKALKQTFPSMFNGMFIEEERGAMDVSSAKKSKRPSIDPENIDKNKAVSTIAEQIENATTPEDLGKIHYDDVKAAGMEDSYNEKMDILLAAGDQPKDNTLFVESEEVSAEEGKS